MTRTGPASEAGPERQATHGEDTESNDSAASRGYWSMMPVAVLTDRNVSDGACVLYAWLDAKAGRSTIAMASQAETAAALGCSIATVRRRVRDLVAAGWLTVEREPAGHGRGWYRVLNPARRGAKTVTSTAGAEVTTLSDAAPDLAPLELVELPEMSALLESFEGSGGESRDAYARESGCAQPTVKLCRSCGHPVTSEACLCPF